jgi:Family of unknown function (DUF6275)
MHLHIGVTMPDQNDVVPANVPVVAPGVPGESHYKEQLAAIKPVIEDNGSSPEIYDPVMKARQIVTDFYNSTRNEHLFPAMTAELVRILWFTGTRGNFKATCEFTVVHNLQYVISYNSRKKEAYIEVFKKQSTARLENA